MTAKREFGRRTPKPRAHTLSAGAIAFLLMSALSFFLILFHVEQAVAAMKKALELCAKSVIPSLFPFMVVSDLLVSGGAGKYLGNLCAPFFRRVFGIGSAGSSVILLGALCGFPIGAKSAADLCEAGKIDRRELSYLLCFCNQPSSAFVTSVVGVSLFGSYRFGLLLYGTTLTSGLVIGIVCRFLLLHDTAPKSQKSLPTPSYFRASTLTDAVTRSAHAMLSVCAFVCFFATLVACLEGLPAMTYLPAPLSALLVGFFELTGGVARAVTADSPLLAAYAAAWCLGWSGLSVHFQVLCLCDHCHISFRPYFAAKAAHGILNVVLLYLVLLMCPTLLPNERLPAAMVLDTREAWLPWLVLFGVAWGIGIARWGKRALQKTKNGKNCGFGEQKAEKADRR